MTAFDTALDWLGRRIAARLQCEPDPAERLFHCDLRKLSRILRPADVILIDGCQKVATAIKYLTQSTWSHTTLYVGDALGPRPDGGEPHTIVEVNVGEGCVSAPLSKYESYNIRICRPVDLMDADRERVVRFMIDRIGLQYDLRNIIDLARYLLPQPPVPVRWRRQMIALGSGEPTRAICSSLIAQAFQSVHYPILPRIQRQGSGQHGGGYTHKEILHIRHHSLFAPRDFDLSPYFMIVKPAMEEAFNYKHLSWAEDDSPAEPAFPDPASRVPD